jgi:ATP-dependent Clp protease ATP-binding subunit ClpC
VDFRNTVIVMTSNVGARRIGKGVSLGFHKDEADGAHSRMRERVLDEAKKVFNPEFMNRVDEMLTFHRLTQDELLEVVDIEVLEVINRVAEKEAEIVLSPESKRFLAQIGSNEEYGARPLRRAVQKYIEDPLAELLLRGGFQSGSRIRVKPSETEEKLVFTIDSAVAEGVSS